MSDPGVVERRPSRLSEVAPGVAQLRRYDRSWLRADLDYRVNLKNELLLSEVLRRLETLESHRAPQSNDKLEFRPGD